MPGPSRKRPLPRTPSDTPLGVHWAKRAARMVPLALLVGLAGPSGPTAAQAAPGPLPPETASAAPAERIAPPPEDPLREARWCRLCHPGDRFSADAWIKTAHTKQVCRDCHDGYHFNPHQPVTLGPEAADTGEGATPEKRRAQARAACVECHAKVLPPAVEKDGHIPHGKAEGSSESKNGPTCRDCHGDPHEVVAAKSLDTNTRRKQQNARCNACHADEKKMEGKAFGIEPALTYAHSVHSRKLDLGSVETPGCVDCHGAHVQNDLKNDGAKVCGKCHDHATPEFVTAADHRPFTREARPVSYFTLKFFGWLTFLTIFALCIHVLLDVGRSLRTSWLASTQPPHPSSDDDETPSSDGEPGGST